MRRQTKVLFVFKTSVRVQRYFRDKLRDYPEVSLIFPSDISPESLMSYAPDIDIMIGWGASAELLKASKKLALFIGAGTGIQDLIEPFRELNKYRSVILCNSHSSAYQIAQQVVAMLLTLTNRIIHHHRRMAEGKWRPYYDDSYPSIPLRGRKVGLLGYGPINANVHRLLSGFDLTFHVLKRDWKIRREDPPTPIEKYSLQDLHRFLEIIDLLIIALPLTSKTAGLIGKKELELLGPDGLLVNVARGAIVDEESLYAALKDKTIAGAAIDVWYDYSPKPDKSGRTYASRFPFHELDNVVLSPHRAASPFDDPSRWDDIIENIRRFADSRRDLLNVMSLEDEY